MEHVIHRALLTAHLLTGNIQQAERAVLHAIDQVEPDGAADETLLRHTMRAAVRDLQVPSTNQAGSAELSMPAELEAVLRLSPDLRRCFVLRFLAGLSRRTCARLLRLNAVKVDQYTCAALECLAGSGTAASISGR